MVQRVITQLVSDLSGDDIEEGGQTVTFSYQGSNYSIDLTDEEADRFDEALGPYLIAATKVAVSSPRRSNGKRKRPAHDTKAIRKWAQSNGHAVADRGRIPSSVADAYRNQANYAQAPPAWRPDAASGKPMLRRRADLGLQPDAWLS